MSPHADADTPVAPALHRERAAGGTNERINPRRARLTDREVKAARPGARPQRLWDGAGLYLQLTPAGGKLWRLRYFIGGKEKLLALGAYPEVTLKEARDLALDARRMVARGQDPSAAKRAEKAAAAGEGTFAPVAREWHARRVPTWAASHAVRVLRALERDAFPYLGARPVGEIGAVEVLAVLRRVEERGAIETAHRLKIIVGQVLRYAVATGRATRDPTGDLRGALSPAPERHFPAQLDAGKLGGILRAIDGYQGTPAVSVALRLQPLLMARPGELRSMRWADLDLDGALWSFTASKTGRPHVVPLARQALALLSELRPLTGAGEFVFPCARLRSSGRCMSNATINAALRRCGVDTRTELTGHGWRAVARTLLEEKHDFRPEVIELQLAHAVKDPLGRAYNRTQHLDERKRMMQVWADHLDGLRAMPAVEATGEP